MERRVESGDLKDRVIDQDFIKGKGLAENSTWSQCQKVKKVVIGSSGG
ncbi:4368_t:CDS:2 [Acaulospora morrowiae]|uniref:4368_t:CDS:1 n=1 Tax=Acaulospora morrowiae TaxID=94023 RepID=A0A9N8WSY6_9GLOM|nr:4368_t:CDS:2 [Acaulospora morrowiae]